MRNLLACLLLTGVLGVGMCLRMRGEPLVGLTHANTHRYPSDRALAPESRVIGGEAATLGFAPYVVSIQNRYYYHLCAGAIIDDQWVLTAASCVAGLQKSNLRILTGTIDWWNQTNPEYRVEQAILHCNFDKPIYHNDIALLKLSTKIEYNDITKKIPVAELDELQLGEKLTFIGWGSTSIGDDYPQLLQRVQGTYLPYGSCRQAHNNSNDVDLGHLCVAMEKGKGMCHGDSGGPLVNDNGQLVGISNWGVPCAYGFPDVYAKVPFYNDWIRTTIKGCTRK